MQICAKPGSPSQAAHIGGASNASSARRDVPVHIGRLSNGRLSKLNKSIKTGSSALLGYPKSRQTTRVSGS